MYGDVVRGTVSFVASDRGFGFVRLDGGGTDVYFRLDAGIVPGVGWEASPMATVRLVDTGRWGSDWKPVVADPPKRGDRLALSVQQGVPKRSVSGGRPKGPTARWWSLAPLYEACEREIAIRAGQYPIGAYYYPRRAAEGGRDVHRMLIPGRDREYASGQENIPAQWAVVEVPGEMPHVGDRRGHDRDILAPSNLDDLPIVQGLTEYVRDELEPTFLALVARQDAYRQWIDGKLPTLEVDATGSGTIRYGEVSFAVVGGRLRVDESYTDRWGNYMEGTSEMGGIVEVPVKIGGANAPIWGTPLYELVTWTARASLDLNPQSWAELVERVTEESIKGLKQLDAIVLKHQQRSERRRSELRQML